MKINLKDNKIISIIVVLIILGGIFLGYEKITNLENKYVNLSSREKHIKDCIIERNKLILKSKEDILKYEDTKDSVKKISDDSKKLQSLDMFSKDANEINKKIDIYENANKNVEKLMNIYNNNLDMKKDKNISEIIESIIEKDLYIDDIIEVFNTVEKEDFNKAIESFPINIIAKNKGWESIVRIQNN